MQNAKLKVGAEAEKIPGYLLWQVSKLWQRRLNVALSGLKLSSTQAVILINVPRLSQEQKTVTQVQLAEVTKVDRMTVSQSIRTLERKKLIQRVTAPNDKRAYHIELTEIGSGVAMQAIEIISAAHQTFFQPLVSDADLYIELTQRLLKANDIKEGA